MTTKGCAYCCGDLTMVEGLLGRQFFCPACRRFQPTAQEGNVRPPASAPRKATSSKTEPAEEPKAEHRLG